MKSSRFASATPPNSQPKEYVDLHMHSTFSDGALKVKQLIDLCQEQGLSAIAVTDHDNIDSFEEGREHAEKVGIEYVPGVEISSSEGGSDIHILGYLFDPTHLKLNQTLVELRERRRHRAKQIVKRLDALGVTVDYEQISAKAQGGSVGRAHIANQLLEDEYVQSFQEAFIKYLGNDTSVMAGLDSAKLSPANAIQLILDAGGVPVMAHPSKTNRDDLIEELVECGLKGIETYCHGQNQTSYRKYRTLAEKYHLICSGGADFHTRRPDGKHGPGSLNVPYKVLSMLKEAKGRPHH